MWSSLAGGVYHRVVFIRGNTLEVLLMYIKGKKVKFQNQPIAPCTFPFSFISPWVTHSNKSKLPSLNTNLKQKPTTPIHIMHVIKSGHTGRGKQRCTHPPNTNILAHAKKLQGISKLQVFFKYPLFKVHKKLC